tara:strand:- start:150 stop:614 length:465 start_codon:yes stop_codon:yes gene_type:complete
MATLATEPGRGRKHCPGCNKYPGSRARACSGCGHQFVNLDSPKKTSKVKKKKVEDEEPDDDTPFTRNTAFILTPRGAPPKLAGIGNKNVKAWMALCREECRDGYLSTEALVYWARQLFPRYKKNEEGTYVQDGTAEKVAARIRKIDAKNPKATI